MTLELVAEFVGDPRQTDWHRAYVDARMSVQGSRPVTIHDISDAGRNAAAPGNATILFHVIRAHEVHHTRNRHQLVQSCTRQIQDGRMTLAVATFGETAHEAVDVVLDQLGPQPAGLTRWIAGVVTINALRDQIAEWLLLVVDRRLPARIPYEDSEAVLADEMPATEAGTAAAKKRRLRGMP